jgi:hypothetical protein
MPSPAQMLELLVRLPLKASKSVYIYSVCVFLVMGCSPTQGVLQTVYKIQNFGINFGWEQARQPNLSRQKKSKDSVIIFINSKHTTLKISME